MIYCPKCGRQLPDEALFCASCGAKIIMRKDDPPAEPAKSEVVELASEIVPEPVKAETVPETEPAKAEFVPEAEPAEFVPEPAPAEPVKSASDAIRETLGVPPAPIIDEAKPSPAKETAEPVREEAREEIPEEEPRRKRPEQPLTASNMLSIAGFAMAFVSPLPAIVLSALAKKALKRKRTNTYTRLANWGLFLGIVFMAVLIGVLVATSATWTALITDIFK
ncbi:MAG: zinc-ribbon domain-containing protein [Clostridiales bacterium]|nr:zinc-ribbon domain-containing protein [Clostridiales bacterium]